MLFMGYWLGFSSSEVHVASEAARKSRPDLEAADHVRRIPFSAVVKELSDVLGPKLVAYIAGAHQTQNDILYFSYGPDNSSFDLTTQLPELAFDPAFRPNATQTFLEINDRNRTVSGWRLPAVRQPFARMRATFAPNIPTPNLHFRYISTDNQTNQNTQMVLDDLVVRRALNPDFRVTLGPVEAR